MTDEYETDDEYKRIGSDITVFDTLAAAGGRVRKMVFVTPLVIRDGDSGNIDRGVNHRHEAIKVFKFLQQWISCKTYDHLYKMMSKSDSDRYYSPHDEVNCVANSYDRNECYDSIHQLERTILVLESVRKLYVEGACAGCMPEAVRTMVDNEVALLRNKVDEIANEDGDES